MSKQPNILGIRMESLSQILKFEQNLKGRTARVCLDLAVESQALGYVAALRFSFMSVGGQPRKAGVSLSKELLFQANQQAAKTLKLSKEELVDVFSATVWQARQIGSNLLTFGIIYSTI